MEFPPELGTIEGAKNLRDWFGYWPSFHDAEVILLHLNRSDASTLAVHTWEMTKEVDEKGFYVLAKHVVVEFVMKEVVEEEYARSFATFPESPRPKIPRIFRRNLSGLRLKRGLERATHFRRIQSPHFF